MAIKITGISFPFPGISWEYTEGERQQIQKLFYFLEGKRLLINPADMELPNQCAVSAMEIEDFIVKLLCTFKFSHESEKN